MLTRTKEKSMIWSHAMLFVLFILFINVDADNVDAGSYEVKEFTIRATTVKCCWKEVSCLEESNRNVMRMVGDTCLDSYPSECFEFISKVKEHAAINEKIKKKPSVCGSFFRALITIALFYTIHSLYFTGSHLHSRVFYWFAMNLVLIIYIVIEIYYCYTGTRARSCEALKDDMQLFKEDYERVIQEIEQLSAPFKFEEMTIKGSEIATQVDEDEEMIDYSTNKNDVTLPESVPTTSFIYSETSAAFDKENDDSSILNAPPSEAEVPKTVKPAKKAKPAKFDVKVKQPKKVLEEKHEVIMNTDYESYAIVCMVIGIVFCYVLYAYMEEPNTEESTVYSV